MVTRMNLVAPTSRPAVALHLKASAGVTLIELLTVITIVAILAALGAPSYRYVTDSNRISARSEAIKEGQTVTVCSSANPTAVAATCSGSNSWQSGWIVFSDPNGNATVDANEPILRVQRPFALGDTFASTPGTSAVTFNREGFALGIVNNVTVTLHAVVPSTGSTRCLQITIVGQLTTQTSGQGACI
jgi:type IV fimbrial biogenesis protein FimT